MHILIKIVTYDKNLRTEDFKVTAEKSPFTWLRKTNEVKLEAKEDRMIKLMMNGNRITLGKTNGKSTNDIKSITKASGWKFHTGGCMAPDGGPGELPTSMSSATINENFLMCLLIKSSTVPSR